MKICTLQAIISIALCSLAVAHKNHAQVLDKKITLTLKEVSIEEALDAIEAVTDVKFFYSVDQLNIRDKISFEAIDRSLRDLLDELLGPYQIKYKVHERKSTITLKRQQNEEQSLREEDEQETIGREPHVKTTITGIVTDAQTRIPMAGVNILIKGTTQGTASDEDGNYTISADDNDILVFSFIGYTTFETQVNGRTHIEVTLEENIKNLKEVVVNAGYWEVDDRERTGNIVKVTAEEIQKHPVSNPIAALQGKVPGLEIIQQTGVPGGNFTIRIRGQNSLANGNDPLFIIDGVPYNSTTMAFNETSSEIFGNALGGGGSSPLNAINPADIESIEILKDADATAIYGSRGANGVILITTKKGKPGKTNVDFSFYKGFGAVARTMDLLSISEYKVMRKEALENSNLIPDNANAPDLVVWDTTRSTDWQNELIGQTAHTVDGQFSLSGGDRLTQFSFTAGYRKEGTVFPGNFSDQRLSTSVSLTNTSGNEKFKTSLSIKYVINRSDLMKRDLTSLALTLPPITPSIYNTHGELNWGTQWGTDSWTEDFQHPLRYLKTSYDATTKNLLINAVTSYYILKNLVWRMNMGHSDVNMNGITLTPKASFAPSMAVTRLNESAFSTSNFRNWTLEPQINWKPKLGEGRFDVLLGTTFLEQVQEGLAQFAYGFTDEALMKNIGASANRSLATNYYSQYRYTAGFSRINYVFKDRYIINLTGRRDGSSRFGPKRQFANFGAIGAAWIFSSERIIEKALPFLSFGKIRGSYGITGNDQLGNYQYLDTYTSTGIYQGIRGLAPVRLANPEFAWETNTKAEGAFEVGLFENRILTAVSYYRNISSDQLVGFSLPPTTGFTSIQGNLPAIIENTGFEVELNTRNIEKNGFEWTTSINFSVPRNKLVEFPNLEASPAYANILVEGEPLSILKRYNYLGINPQTGLYEFEDVDDNGTINILDRQKVKFIGQDFYGGIQNTFQYKGLEMNVSFQFVKQTKPNYLSVFINNPGQGLSNQPAWVMDRWQFEGDVKDVQLFSTSPESLAAYTLYASSTASVSNASFIRLKNISLAYSLPLKWLENFRLDNFRIFAQGQNLLTFTKFQGLDPEPTSAFSLPPLKVISAGLSISL